MEKIKKLYNADFLGILILLGIFAFLTPIFWAHQGHPIIDCGREAYIPMEILKGKVLYKDILNIYGPFAYQLNALLYLIFGQNLTTLYFAGYINSLLILTLIYLIARTITTSLVSWTISFIIMVVCVFNYSIFNYVFPYAYAVSYALSAFLLSTLFFIFYFKSSNPKFVPLMCFFGGISLVSKYEYSVSLLALAVIVLFFKPVSKKYLLISLFSLLSVPFISFMALFSQGLTINSYINHLYFMQKILSSSILKYFYTHTVSFYFNKDYLIFAGIIFIHFISNFILSTGFVYLYLFSVKKTLPDFLNSFKLKIILQIIITIIFIWYFPLKLIKENSMGISLAWLPYSATLILIVFAVYFLLYPPLSPPSKGGEPDEGRAKPYTKPLFLLRNLQDNFNNIRMNDKIFILLLIIGITSAFKSYFFLNLHVFGTFILPLILLVNIIFLIDYLPNILEKNIFFKKLLDKKIWAQSCVIIIVCTGIIFSVNQQNIARNFKYPVQTKKGIIYTTDNQALNLAINYINKEMPENASFLMIPEGPILNFLTNRDSDNIYHALIPVYIEAFGEDRIIGDFKKNPPDYIFINNRNSVDYGFPFFCKDYGFRICGFIEQNYKQQAEFGKNFKIKIYKLLKKS
ncbi:MAG: hypothetical protein V2B14_01095 [bacterium]